MPLILACILARKRNKVKGFVRNGRTGTFSSEDLWFRSALLKRGGMSQEFLEFSTGGYHS